jgi:hypothetical protein
LEDVFLDSVDASPVTDISVNSSDEGEE